MKLSKLTGLLSIILVLGLFSFRANAQDKLPEEQMGVGIEVGSLGWIGFQGLYAMNTDMHIGAHFGFNFDGGTKTEPSTTNFLFGPFFRYFFPKMAKSLRPYGEAMFLINTGTKSNATANDPLNTTTSSFTETSINISAGAEWFPYASVSVYGGFRFLKLSLDPTRFVIGLGQPVIGIHWFLDR